MTMRTALVALLVLGAAALFMAPDGCGEDTRRADRLYPGAPPTVPHEVLRLARQECLTCHAAGSRVAPPSPHPAQQRCQQCHVVQQTSKLFVKNTFRSGRFAMGLKQHGHGPPLIPHPLTLRENCAGCHAGPWSPRWIRTSHPERTRCQQCHVPAFHSWPGPRPRGVPFRTVKTPARPMTPEPAKPKPEVAPPPAMDVPAMAPAAMAPPAMRPPAMTP